MKTTSKILFLVGICIGLMIGLYELSPFMAKGVIMWVGLSVLLVAVIWVCRTIAESDIGNRRIECPNGHRIQPGESCDICRNMWDSIIKKP